MSGGPLRLRELDRLVLMIGLRGVRLICSDGAILHAAEDPDALVREVVRLARIGAAAELIEAQRPECPVGEVIQGAHSDWKRMQVC